MELPILLLTTLPESAIKLVTQFLRKPHPCAMLIKQLTFYQTGILSMSPVGRRFTVLNVELGKYTYRFRYDGLTGDPAYSYVRCSIYPPSVEEEFPSSDDDDESSEFSDSEGEL